MASGLLLTGVVAYGVANTQPAPTSSTTQCVTEYGTRIAPTGLGTLSMFAPLAFVLVLSFGVNKLSRTSVQALYWAFCVAMGASASPTSSSSTPMTASPASFFIYGRHVRRHVDLRLHYQ